MKKFFVSILIVIIVGALLWLLFFSSKMLRGQASLSWNKSTSANILGYRVYYGNHPRKSDCPPGGYPDKIDVGNKASYQVDNLKNQETYYFSVTSYNKQGKESCFSEEMSKKISVNLFDKLKVWLKK